MPRLVPNRARLLSAVLLPAVVATVTFVGTADARAEGFSCPMGTVYDRAHDQCVRFDQGGYALHFRRHGRHASHWTRHGTFDQGGYESGNTGSSQSQSDHEVY